MNNQLVEVSYPSAGGLLSEKFGYDKAGNRLTRERRTVDSIIMETYCHDNCNRIKELNRKAYELDGVTPKLKKSPAVSNNPDAVASYIGETSYYGYDRSGNLLSDGSATYTYDGFERTAEVKMANGNSQINRYDAEGLRAEMEENGQLVQFLFNEEKEVIAEQTDDGVIRYIRGLGIICSDSESARTYYHYVSDNQGSVRLMLTDTANDRRIRNYYCYDAFGESVISHEDIHNRFRFNGEQYDPVTSQYYLRARFYNPVIGRFTQEDTYYGDGPNLYEYCRNNPVLYRDPSGHDAVNQGNLYGNGIVNDKTPASRLADKLRGLSNSKRPNTVAVVRTADGKYYVGYNKAGIYNYNIQKVLDYLENKNLYNRQCAEVNAISRAFNDGADLKGATISIANVRKKNDVSGVHGTYKPPCDVCQPLIDFFGIAIIN